ncbi:NADP-dependent oxidoreductase [Pedobacter yonginense]|uniref:NADP-dependent oxidoreductase n=1 Tax=Pedobacter yonginense TaxID=651869 RepID=A0A317EHC1_9SPHI|nr:NADP-dependent oxidoreductase [Pedobacter yonginense]PWS26210.1 NADP-dependent oxidoreductase [Pedobacter yonginense]
MKAIRISEFGLPKVMELTEIDRPVPKSDEILVKVYASGVNPVDLVVRAGSNAALSYNLNLPMTLGWDTAGVIEELGEKVTGFQKGDAVYGVPNFPGEGSYAEYVAAKASRFALKPYNICFNDAAGVPLAALTAWTAMFEFGKLKMGQRILIQGASGSVGGFAVQFAKSIEAYVIGTASADSFDYLRQIGADELIDYKTQKFEDLVKKVDVVLEVSSVRDNNEREKSVQVLKNNGILVSVNTDFPFNEEVIHALDKKNCRGELSANQARKEWLEEIGKLIESGKVKVPQGKIFVLHEAVEAHSLIENKSVNGKLILQVREQDQ